VKTLPPKQESWGVVAGVIDPCGVLWRFYASTAISIAACGLYCCKKGGYGETLYFTHVCH
jgi:hypothetical protein